MSALDWKKIVSTVAPWIGTALGGPLGGMAVDAIGNALGMNDRSLDSVKQALSGMTPDQALALKKADQDFAIRMQELGFKNIETLEQIAAGDRDSARKMQVAAPSRMPAVLTIVVISAFFLALVAMFFIDIPSSNRDTIVYMVGQLAGFAAACVAFWVGTTRQSENKTSLLAQGGDAKGSK